MKRSIIGVGLTALLFLSWGGSAHGFDFYGIEFGMGKDEVEDNVNGIVANRPRRIKLYKSTGGEWGDYMVDAPGRKILSLYFKFNPKDELYWMKVHYPYSLSNPGRNKPILDWVKKYYVQPVRRDYKHINVTLDERRVRLTIVSPRHASK